MLVPCKNSKTNDMQSQMPKILKFSETFHMNRVAYKGLRVIGNKPYVKDSYPHIRVVSFPNLRVHVTCCSLPLLQMPLSSSHVTS